MPDLEELKPCPFCGNSDIRIYDDTNSHIIECENCPAGVEDWTVPISDLVIAWNNRANAKEEKFYSNKQPHTAICPVTAMQCDHAEIVVKCKSAPGTCGYQDKQQ